MLKRNILVTGLKPFGPYKENVSEKLVIELNGKRIIVNNTEFQIKGLALPINFSTFRKELEKTIKNTNPILVIGLGMDFKDSEDLSFEIEAHRKPVYEILKDSGGNTWPNKDLDNLPKTIFLPNFQKLIKTISSIRGIRISNNAGRWVCETILRDLIRLSNDGKNFQPAFIHVPHTKNLLQISKSLDEHKKYLDFNSQKEVLLNIIKKLILNISF